MEKSPLSLVTEVIIINAICYICHIPALGRHPHNLRVPPITPENHRQQCREEYLLGARQPTHRLPQKVSVRLAQRKSVSHHWSEQVQTGRYQFSQQSHCKGSQKQKDLRSLLLAKQTGGLPNLDHPGLSCRPSRNSVVGSRHLGLPRLCLRL